MKEGNRLIKQDQNIDLKAEFIHGFSHKTRIQILEFIIDNEKTVSEIMQQVEGSQSSISQHLACLKGCGLITGRQEGKFIYYSLRNKQVRSLVKMFDDVFTDVQNDVKTCEHHIN